MDAFSIISKAFARFIINPVRGFYLPHFFFFFKCLYFRSNMHCSEDFFPRHVVRVRPDPGVRNLQSQQFTSGSSRALRILESILPKLSFQTAVMSV